MNTHFLAGMKEVFTMTEQTVRLSADELSKGKDFWRRQKRRSQAAFTRTVGDDRLQQILDFQFKCEEAIRRSQVSPPHSRTVYLPQSEW